MPIRRRPPLRGLILFVLLATRAASAAPTPAPVVSDYLADFDELWTQMGESYAYFDKKTTDWDRVREIYRPRAGEVRSREELIGLLEQVLEELYDSHLQLNTNTAHSPRLVPSGADIWARWKDGRARVEEVRPGSAAAGAGVEPGVEVLALNGVPIREAVKGRLGRSLRASDPAADDWALRVLLAGRHDEVRTLGLRAGATTRDVRLPPGPDGSNERRARLEAKRLAMNIGYLRPLNSLGDVALLHELDAALAELRDTRGLVLDLRDTPSGGNTTVARGLMGRFIDREEPYQRHSIPAEERQYGVKRSWIEVVAPRGPFHYAAPLVVLVSHWTGSMGEGIAIGLDAMKRATIVGTRMAGLLGATYTLQLPRTRIGVNAPAEKIFHVDGTPREEFVPRVLVDLATAEARGRADPILEAGLEALR